MKIAVYCRVWTSHGLGGMQVAAREAALGLSKRGHEVHVFTTALHNFKGEVSDEGILVHHIPSPIGKYSTTYFDASFKLFKEIGGFELVYSHSTAARRHLKEDIPLVAHWHGIGGMIDVDNLAKINCFVDSKQFDVEILKYPCHIAPAPHEARYIVQNGVDAQRVHTILYGIDGFKEDSGYRNKIRARFGFIPSDFVIGLTGRLVFDKGIEQVAAVCTKLDKRIRVFLVGEGASVSSFKQNVTHQGTVARHEMCEYYNAMDLLVDPTARNQGFDITPIEAAFCGVPLLLSDVGSFKEVFTQGACFFELGNLDALTAQLNQLCNFDNIKEMKLQIRQLALAKFTRTKMIDGLESVFNQLSVDRS